MYRFTVYPAIDSGLSEFDYEQAAEYYSFDTEAEMLKSQREFEAQGLYVAVIRNVEP